MGFGILVSLIWLIFGNVRIRYAGTVELAVFWKVRLRHPGTVELADFRKVGFELDEFWKVGLVILDIELADV